MSNNRRYQTQFKKIDLLKTALNDLGLHVDENVHKITDYYGSEHKVDFGISGASLPEGRVGMRDNGDEKGYEIVGDFHYMRGMSSDDFFVGLKKKYNLRFFTSIAEDNGCQLVEDKIERGQRRIVMRRLAA